MGTSVMSLTGNQHIKIIRCLIYFILNILLIKNTDKQPIA